MFLLLTLLMLGGMALFARLALWQYHRGQERAAVAADYAAASRGPARPLPQAGAAALPRYAYVTARGRYLAQRQVVLIERPRPHGEAIGAEVLTPLRLDDGRLLLVNRGWVPADADGHTQASLAAPAGPVEVSGHLADLSRAGVRLRGPKSMGGSWPRHLLYPDWRDLDALYGPGLIHRVLWLSPQAPGGYARAWDYLPARGPLENYGYMAQWIGLAATVFIVWLALTLRAVRRARGDERR